jgi:hypothetical protein
LFTFDGTVQPPAETKYERWKVMVVEEYDVDVVLTSVHVGVDTAVSVVPAAALGASLARVVPLPML